MKSDAGIEFRIVKVEDLQPDDMVDLQGDAYADPGGNSVWFEYEMSVVERSVSTWYGTAVHFQDTTIDFPTGHKVKVHNEAYKPELIT